MDTYSAIRRAGSCRSPASRTVRSRATACGATAARTGRSSTRRRSPSFFDETAFALTPSGNGGKRAFPYFETELTPKHDATGIEANFDWDAAAPEVKIRAVVEGQIANMRERTRWIGDFATIYVTGGASRSKGILATIREIFGAEVRTLDVPDSAAVGGAILAARAVR